MKDTVRFFVRTLVPVLVMGAAPISAQDISIPDVGESEVICFALYTVSGGVLKLTAQFYPLPDGATREATLEIGAGDGWREVARTTIIEDGWTAPFRVTGWDDTRAARYRVNHNDTAFYEGTIQRNPIDKNEFVVMAFTGNSIRPNHGGDIPRQDIIDNARHLKPDLLFFSGDQVYHHKEHYKAWLRFGRDFGEIIKDIPTVCIPDDHDVGQSNLWGEAGKTSGYEAGHDGGYFMPVEYVNEVQRAQTSHLPDPHDPTPIERGIGVYYTALTWGGVSFAIIEDRKWKTGPEGRTPPLGPRPDHVTQANYDPAALDVPGAELLGERQLSFLRSWAQDWEDAEMKAVLSQTIFCGGAHLHGQRDNRLFVDLDSNGWPQSGRNAALAEIRKAFALMIGGDQHLGTIIHHGIDDWNDAGYSFCVPSIANLYLRWWAPLVPGRNRAPGAPEYTGEFLDGLGNHVTMWAVANPSEEEATGDRLTTRAAGFGVVRFNKARREMTMECWPRNTDVTTGDAQQYEGWPRTISQSENYGRVPTGFLPTLEFANAVDPVVKVIDETMGEVVYTLRIDGDRFRPKVFSSRPHRVEVEFRGNRKSFTGLVPVPETATTVLPVRF